MSPHPVQRKKVHIFISSPGDVADERNKAREVIEFLQARYDEQLELVPILWEDLALPATSSFQTGIEAELSLVKQVDIAVFILWSRLGSPLADPVVRKDGSKYRSGTEREFDLMLAAHERSGGTRPAILAYTRRDDEGFSDLLDARHRTDGALEELIRQRILLKRFITEHFKDEQGRNLRAYHIYNEPVGFAQRLLVHLRSLLDGFVDLAPGFSLWSEPPYRSLNVFDIRHMPIFCGRDEEICALLQRLREQAALGCSFACIVGASGAGKSSLARAGVAGTLVQRTFDDGVRAWRAAVLTPSLGSGDLIGALVGALAEQVPDLSDFVGGLEKLVARLEGNHEAASDLVAGAFRAASKKLGGSLKLLVVVDQMEELWTDKAISPEQRERFLEAVEVLARSGFVSVLGTLRSDFYALAQLSACFLRLKGDEGHYDLVPPGASALRELIVKPAHRAGISFEWDAQTSRTLDQVILEEATKDSSALPLLQYALAELYEHRDLERSQLTFESYRHIGGVEGALQQRLSSVFDQLDEQSRNCLDQILPLLITVDTRQAGGASRRQALMSDLLATPERAALTHSLTEGRFLTSDCDSEGRPVATLAHESLLRKWPQLVNWLERNRDHLRLRTQIEQSEHRWEQSSRDPSLFLTSGLPLDEGQRLLTEAPSLLASTTSEYIRLSLANSFKQAIESNAELPECSAHIEKDHPQVWRSVIAEAFHSSSVPMRRNVGMLLASIRTKDFEPELVNALLFDGDGSVRQAAAHALVANGNISAYDRVRDHGRAGSGRKRLSPESAQALGILLAISDMQPDCPEFERWYSGQEASVTKSIYFRSVLNKFRQALPLFLFIIIPSTIFAAAGSASVKWLPSAFNYSCVQATSSWFMGIFHSFPSGIILGGSIVTGLTIYRLVFGKEHEDVTRFRPYPAILFGAGFGFAAGILCVVMVALVYQPEALQQIGWTNSPNSSIRPPVEQLLYEVFVRNRCGLAFPLSSVGLGISLALMTNRLRASTQWSAFVNGQSAITGFEQLRKVVWGIFKVTLPFGYPILMFVPLFAVISLVLMNTGEIRSDWAFEPLPQVLGGGLDDRPPNQSKADGNRPDFGTGASPDEIRKHDEEMAAFQRAQVQRRTHWKNSLGGRCLGLLGDIVAKMTGGYFSIVGMGLGIIMIRHGVKIDPKKLHG